MKSVLFTVSDELTCKKTREKCVNELRSILLDLEELYISNKHDDLINDAKISVIEYAIDAVKEIELNEE